MEENSKEKDLFKRGKNDRGYGFAVFLIVFGGLFLFFNMGIIPVEYKPILISWQMFLVLLGLWTLIKGHYVGGFSLMVVGVFFLYPSLCSVFPEFFVRYDVDIKTYWPLLLIIIGLFLVLGRFIPNRSRKVHYGDDRDKAFDENSTDYIEKNMVFGSSEQIILSQNFEGGEVNTVFGEVILDLRKAKLADGSVNLELNTVFGSLILYVPSDWKIQMKTSTVLGSFQDKRHSINNVTTESGSYLIIEGNSVFGSGEIRN